MTCWMLLLCLLAAEPADACRDDADDAPPPVRAAWAAEPITLDGRLDEPVWQTAATYPLALSRDRQDQDMPLHEPGQVQFAYDHDHLYVAFHFRDSDVVQESDENQRHHYQTGDVAELFLKPDEQSWYWELYATPNARHTTFFFPGRGRLGLPSGFEPEPLGLRVGAQIDGTLNHWRDRDEGWTAELAVPRAALAAQGVPLSPEHPWRVLVGRYNYSRYLDQLELSMYPPLSATDYHRLPEYAPLLLLPPPDDAAEPAE